ncbi:hypothetical protein GQ44DRAFT_732469 [Phaeosphaeriaceae sp. PMI808]|nr:hypothetical protein GQ44DRAFT_732469 [Phaeosphaeriaceae sp. PMI808]
MKFTTTTLLAATALVPLAASLATLNQCIVSHQSDGNIFDAHFNSVPDVSQSTICGHSKDGIGRAASGSGVNVKSISCTTDGSQMTVNVKFDKQSPSVQRSALVQGLTASFGSQGVNINPSICNINGIP